MAKINSLTELLSPSGQKLLTASGKELIKEIGFDVVRNVVFNIMTGRNLRDSTEPFTRKRIAALNLATLTLFLEGTSLQADFIEQLPELASTFLKQKGLSKSERWLSQWVLGLTDKASQNVLRGDKGGIDSYRDAYIKTCEEVIALQQSEKGDLTGKLYLNKKLKSTVSWLSMVYLLNTVGAQTLTIRGSEKSAYGKLFEKLVLGSLLHVLGFKFVPPNRPGQDSNVFWLSSRENKRESDATLLYEDEKAVRFDIGFIGPGNSEISLDKVSRFEREFEVAGRLRAAEVIIIVDRIGKGSRILDLAHRINGHIVQMSSAYWPQHVAKILAETIGYEGNLVDMAENSIEPFLQSRLQIAPLEEFIKYTEDVLLDSIDTDIE